METSEIAELCSKPAHKHLRSVLNCSKNTLFRTYYMPIRGVKRGWASRAHFPRCQIIVGAPNHYGGAE